MPLYKLYETLPPFLQNAVCSTIGYGISKKRYNQFFYKTLDWLLETDYWSIEKLEDYQRISLKNLIRHSYETVPYYHELFNKLKLKPCDIDTKSDLKKLPILTKQIVRNNRNLFISTIYKKNKLTRIKTSGTTGAGLEFLKQPEAISFQSALWWRFRKRFGLKMTDWSANFSGKKIVPLSHTKAPFWRHNLALHQTYFSAYHLKEENIPNYFEQLNSNRYVYFCGYPSIISIIAEFMIKNKLSLSRQPKVITTGSETLLPSQSKLISEAFGCKVVDYYGAAEGICSLSRCQCENYHEDMELGIIEYDIIEEHKNSKSGKVIATGLIDKAMPLIRYDMGDVISFTEEKCKCGRQSLIAIGIDGRSESYIITPDGRKIGRMASIFVDLAKIYESQIIQISENLLVVRVVRRNGYTKEDEVKFGNRIRGMVGNNMQISFEYFDHIPREKNGKFRAVVNQFHGI